MDIIADIIVLSVPFTCIISYGVITIIENKYSLKNKKLADIPLVGINSYTNATCISCLTK